jgi:hypothetical protein
LDIHLIDEFRRRTNASYDEARSYLDMYNGDLLEAIIAFERERTGYQGRERGYQGREQTGYQSRERAQAHAGGFLNGLIRVVQTLFDIKVVITDRNMRTFAIPVIILLILCPIWHIIIPMAIILLILGFRFSVSREYDPNINIESLVNNLKSKVNECSRNYQGRQ